MRLAPQVGRRLQTTVIWQCGTLAADRGMVFLRDDTLQKYST